MDNILRSGDTVIFLPNFGKAIIVPVPGVLNGTAATVMTAGPPTCVEGDEKLVIVPGVVYTSPPFVTPGTGTLMIQQLGSDQLSQKTTIGGKKVMLKGTMFDAKFQVIVPAMQPTPAGPVPDPMVTYMGKGQFVTTNVTVTDGG